MSHYRYTGVAPEATILSYKVFSDGGDVSNWDKPFYITLIVLIGLNRELWMMTL